MCGSVVAALLLSVTAEAADITWDGTTSTDWFTAGNWTPTPGAVPTATDNALLNNPTPTNPNAQIGAPGAAAASVTIDNGNALTVTATGVLTAGTGGVIVGGAGTLNNAGAVGPILNNAGTLNNTGSLGDIINTGTMNNAGIADTVANSGTLNMTGGVIATLSQSGGATAVSGGTVVLATIDGGSVNLSGTGALNLVFVNSGTLNLGGTTQTGSFTLAGGTFTNGTWTCTGACDLQSGIETASGVLAGAAGVTKTTGGTVTLGGINTYSGGTTISGGVLSVSADNNLGAAAGGITFSGGTLRATASFTTARAVNITTAGTFDVTGGNTLTVAGGISGVGGTLTKIGGGTLALSAANTYTGDTTVTAGTLTIAATGSITSNVVNNATFNNAGTVTGNLLSNTGTAANSGTWTGTVTTSGTFNNAAAGTVSGLFTNNGGTATNAGQLNGGVVVNGGTFTTTNLVNGGLTNAATVNAQGAVNGAIVNNAGTFTVTGNLTSDAASTFTNSATLHVQAGTYTLLNPAGKSLTNMASGSVVIDGGTTLDASAGGGAGNGVLNAGSITNNGTFRDDLDNTGTFVNGGTSVAVVNSNTGTITNNGNWTGNVVSNANALTNAGTWTGNLLSNTGTVANSGTWTGTVTTSGTFNNTGSGTVSGLFTNNGGTATNAGQLNGGVVVNGGTLNTTGLIAGGLLNNATVNAQGTINGAVTNTGTFNVTGPLAPITTFNNTGTISLATPATTLAVTNYNPSAGSQLNVAVNFATGQASQLNTTNVTGTGTTTVNLALTPGVNPKIGPAIPFNTGTQFPAAAGSGFGLYPQFGVDVSLCGNSICTSLASAAQSAFAGAAGSVVAALNAIDVSFHQSTSPFVASPPSTEPNKWVGGIWSRATTGQVTTDSTALLGSSGPLVPLRVKTTFDAYQVGIDSGLLNFGDSGWNGHVGFTLGGVQATANEQLGSGTQVKFDTPFVGFYGVFTSGRFFSDIDFRRDWHHDTVSIANPFVQLASPNLTGHGTAVSGSAGYHFDLPSNWFIEPSAAYSHTETVFNPLATAVPQAGALVIDRIISDLGRVGVRVGTSVTVDKFSLQPFGTFSVWREFSSSASENFIQNQTSVPIGLDRVGTFYQAGIGISGQIIGTGAFGFVRGDVRFGDKIDGIGIIGGARIAFP